MPAAAGRRSGRARKSSTASNPAWATYGIFEYDKLVGATASSPIVAGPGENSNQRTFGLGLTYSFAMTGLPF
jgi:outer membrane scaffolding protein for murein synthesis (MipA/OmpV family)